MEVFSIRVDAEVKERLNKVDKDYIRKILTEIAGLPYTNENELIDTESILQKSIKNIVDKYLKDNIEKLIEDYIKNNIDKFGEKNTFKNEAIDKEITELAKESILSIINNQ